MKCINLAKLCALQRGQNFEWKEKGFKFMCAEKMHLQLKPKDDDSFFVNTQIIAQWLRKVFLTKNNS